MFMYYLSVHITRHSFNGTVLGGCKTCVGGRDGLTKGEKDA